jgi:hypothetical protein
MHAASEENGRRQDANFLTSVAITFWICHRQKSPSGLLPIRPGVAGAKVGEPARRPKQNLTIFRRARTVEPQHGRLVAAGRSKCCPNVIPGQQILDPDPQNLSHPRQVSPQLASSPGLPLRDRTPADPDSASQAILRQPAR